MKVLTTILLLAICVPLRAQEGLYAPAPPQDAALVRVINATFHDTSLDIGPLGFRDISPAGATAYRPLVGDVVVVTRDGAREVITPQPGDFLTVLLAPGRVLVFVDERHTDPARSQLVVYNVASQSVSLRALEPQATVIPAVAPGEAGVRTVNAVPVRLSAGTDDGPQFVVALDLARGESYALVYVGEAEPPGFVVQATVSAE